MSASQSNSWGNFCTPEEAALAHLKYSSLHCYTVGQIIGLLLVVVSSVLSITSLLAVFFLIARNVICEWRQRSGRRLIEQPMDVFLLSLFFAEFVMSLGGSLNIKYIHDGKVQIGTACKTQAVLSSVGPGTLAMTTLVIAIYTFIQVWWQTRRATIRVAWIIVGVIWAFVILFVLSSVTYFGWDTFFHPTPFWCWIGQYYIVQRLFAEYFWVWSAMLSGLLYIPLFLWSRGYVTPDPNVWWKFGVHSRSPGAVENQVERRLSMSMIAYPLLYAFLVIPQSVIRWLGFVQEDTGRHVNHIPAVATFTGRVIYGLSGICNVVLFLTTRPNLLLMGQSSLRDPEQRATSSTDSERPQSRLSPNSKARDVNRETANNEMEMTQVDNNRVVDKSIGAVISR